MADNGVSFVLQSLNRLLEQDTDLLNPKLKWRINQISSLGIPSQTDHFHLNTTRIEKKSNDAGGTCMHVVTLARSTIHEAASRNSSISLATMLVILFCQKKNMDINGRGGIYSWNYTIGAREKYIYVEEVPLCIFL